MLGYFLIQAKLRGDLYGTRIYGNKNIELLDSYKHVLLHDCNPIQYAESLNNIKDIGRCCLQIRSN